MALNSCNFLGRLTEDPRLDYVGKDRFEKVTFSLAVDDDRRKEDGSRETQFFDFIAWRGSAIYISNVFHKGETMLVVNTHEKVRKYTDKDGKSHRKVEHEVASDSKIYKVNRRRDQHENTQYASQPEDYQGDYQGYYGQDGEDSPF